MGESPMAVNIRKRLPCVENINPSVEWFWIPVQVAMDLPAADFEGEPLSYRPGKWGDSNAQSKRDDRRYEALVDSIREQGFFDPVFVGDGVNDPWSFCHDSNHGLGNGHHRVVAALDLGFTHIPATSDARFRWSETGPVKAW